MHPLTLSISLPLEREFEAWCVAAIERDLRKRRVPFSVWAVSPDDEKSWPADEQTLFAGKLIGLQFKRPHLANGPLKYDRLNWQLHSPSGQFALLQSIPEIFYCLPTFVNRAMRNRCLHHVLFWRPEGASHRSAWYDNVAARSSFNAVAYEGYRWGHFIELIGDCSVGIPLSSPAAVIARLREIRSSLRDLAQDPDTPTTELQVFLIAAPI